MSRHADGLTRREVLQRTASVVLGGIFVSALPGCGSPTESVTTGAPGVPAKPPASGGTTAAPSSASAKPGVTLRLSYGFGVFNAPWLLAAANKIYEKWNLSVTLTPLAASPAMLEGIAADQLDTATATIAAALPAFDKGLPINAILSNGYGGDRFAICARPDAGIKTVKDLVGKRVAVTFGIAQHQVLIEALKAVGSDTSKVQLFNMAGPDMASAFAGKSIDAAVGLDPDVSNWIKAGTAVVVERGGKYMAAPATINIRRSLIEQNPDDVYRFTLAMVDSFHTIRNKGQTSDEVVTQVAGLLKADKELTRESMRYNVYDPRLTPYFKDEVRKDGEFAVSRGTMKAVPDLDKYFATTFIERAQKEHPELFDDIPSYLTQMNVTAPAAR